MQDAIEETLARAGYDHYETSAYARVGWRARHNVNYWMFGDYLGIGAGAHSKITLPDRILRQARYRQPKEYMERAAAGAPAQTDADIAAGDIAFEFMMNALRLNEGFPVALFEERTGLPLTTVLPTLDEAERRGFITRDHAHVAPTELGRRFLNELLQLFMR
jgi:oxygen-independent coproporphyrinogen-3 oxidase